VICPPHPQLTSLSLVALCPPPLPPPPPRLAYSLQVLSTKGIGMRIMLVLIGALPLIAVGGWAYHRASGLGLRESLYKVCVCVGGGGGYGRGVGVG
jgi:hypothetical protein